MQQRAVALWKVYFPIWRWSEVCIREHTTKQRRRFKGEKGKQLSKEHRGINMNKKQLFTIRLTSEARAERPIRGGSFDTALKSGKLSAFEPAVIEGFASWSVGPPLLLFWPISIPFNHISSSSREREQSFIHDCSLELLFLAQKTGLGNHFHPHLWSLQFSGRWNCVGLMIVVVEKMGILLLFSPFDFSHVVEFRLKISRLNSPPTSVEGRQWRQRGCHYAIQPSLIWSSSSKWC